jgi:hypothetical protein
MTLDDIHNDLIENIKIISKFLAQEYKKQGKNGEDMEKKLEDIASGEYNREFVFCEEGEEELDKVESVKDVIFELAMSGDLGACIYILENKESF